MKQNLISSQSLGAFPSPGPGAADYQDNKGWSSERVPRPSESSRRHISALTPFNSGRALPSKWEDAERWICSPVMGYGVAKSALSQHPRRPKSKSGPIVPPPAAMTYYSNYSPNPIMQGLDGGSIRNFVGNSPFSTGVLMPNGVGFHYGGRGGEQVNVERSISVPAWSDLLVSESSLPSSADEKADDIDEAENAVTRVISRRDMATQMSPEDTSHSSPSPTGRFSYPPPIPPLRKLQSEHTAKLEVREVQVDKRATMISWSKRQSTGKTRKGVPDIEDFNYNVREVRSSSWDISEAGSDFSKLQREEAKITAWENLQKAKAEASIRRLEMKLEKKRSSSMDKILSKLRLAEMKAEEMRRSSVSVKQEYKIPKLSRNITFFRRHFRVASLSSCFVCHTY